MLEFKISTKANQKKCILIKAVEGFRPNKFQCTEDDFSLCNFQINGMKQICGDEIPFAILKTGSGFIFDDIRRGDKVALEIRNNSNDDKVFFIKVV